MSSGRSNLKRKLNVEEEPESGVSNNLQEYLKEISIKKQDRILSGHLVQEALQEVVGIFDENSRFSKKYYKSGSNATRTKICEANEYDYDIPLKEPDKYSVLEGFYVSCKTFTFVTIPKGYAEVHQFGKVITPDVVRKDLHSYVYRGVSKYNDVRVKQKPSGPAVTFEIQSKQSIGWNISVDLSPSLRYDEKLLDWPRQETKVVLPSEDIKKVIDVGIHLVPKGEKFWLISVSRAERELMNVIDIVDSGCRKQCHKLLKADFENWKKRSNTGLSEISTFLFKHQLFWMNEEKPFINWSNDKLAECYLSVLSDLYDRLQRKEILNYFRAEENLLREKDPAVVTELAGCAIERAKQLRRK